MKTFLRGLLVAMLLLLSLSGLAQDTQKTSAPDSNTSSSTSSTPPATPQDTQKTPAPSRKNPFRMPNFIITGTHIFSGAVVIFFAAGSEGLLGHFRA